MATIGEMRRQLLEQLSEVEPDVAEYEADWILTQLLRIDRLHLQLNSRESAPTALQERINAVIAQRRNGKPLAYILGSVEFYGLNLLVDDRVLIPRPETEVVVVTALKTIRKSRPAVLRVVDVGTGSGCIACAIAHRIEGVSVIGTDIDQSALALARCNVQNLGLGERISLARANGLASFADRTFDLIVSNPPYIASQEAETLPISVREFEPTHALFAGERGLDVIEPLIAEAARVLRVGCHFVCEIAPHQSALVTGIVKSTGQYETVEILQDLTGRDRVLLARVR